MKTRKHQRGFLGAVFGQVGNWIHDWATSAWKQDKAEGMMEDSQNFAAQEASAARAWQEHMSNTQYQRSTKDMMAAGLNPMLAYHQGGAGTPTGAMASAPGASTPPFNNSHGANLMQTAAQIKLLDENARVADAEVRRKDAETAEIQARTPTHGVNIDRMQQEIQESVARIQGIQQQIRVGVSSAAHLDQQVRNLQETIPQIRATVTQLGTLSKLNEASAVHQLTSAGLNEAQAKEVYQKLNNNLPAMERALMDLDRKIKEMSLPGHMATEAAQDSLVGTIGAYLKALLPLQGMGLIPAFGTRTKPVTGHTTVKDRHGSSTFYHRD